MKTQVLKTLKGKDIKTTGRYICLPVVFFEELGLLCYKTPDGQSHTIATCSHTFFEMDI